MSQDPNDVTRQKSPQSKLWRSWLTHQDFSCVTYQDFSCVTLQDLSCVTYQDFSCMTNQDFRSPGGRVSKSVTWCFTPSQPWQLYIRTKRGREGDGNVIQVCTVLLPTCFFIISSADVVCCCLFFCVCVLNTEHSTTTNVVVFSPLSVDCSQMVNFSSVRHAFECTGVYHCLR